VKITARPVDSNVWRNRFAFCYKGGLPFSQQPQVAGPRAPPPPPYRVLYTFLCRRPVFNPLAGFPHTRARLVLFQTDTIESFTRTQPEKHKTYWLHRSRKPTLRYDNARRRLAFERTQYEIGPSNNTRKTKFAVPRTKKKIKLHRLRDLHNNNDDNSIGSSRCLSIFHLCGYFRGWAFTS